MKHYSLEQWARYVREELAMEEQLEYEAHLGSCDQCLEQYMQCLELARDSFPVLAEQPKTAMADAVMQSIVASVTQSEAIDARKPEPVTQHHKKITPSFLRHPVFHYAVAAAVTFLLMSTGVFHSLAERVGSAETNVVASPPVQEDRSSVSQRIMEKTIGMLDSIQPKHERGGNR